MAGEPLVFRVHAIQRMFQRGLSEVDVRLVLESGDVIQEYPDDQPYPSRLVLGWSGPRPIHVVVSENQDDHEVVVITVMNQTQATGSRTFGREGHEMCHLQAWGN